MYITITKMHRLYLINYEHKDSSRYDPKWDDPNPNSTAIAERGRAAAGEPYRPF